ncbi:MAG: hypothetical protein ACI3XA_09920 [Clostridia bacterium]
MVRKVKKAAEKFFCDECDIYETRAVTENGRTTFIKMCVNKSIPCRVSAKAYLFGENAAKEGDMITKVSKKVKLYLPSEYDVKEGSIIEVKSSGRIKVFGKSGVVNYYPSHNEVMIEISKDYA